MLEYFLLLVGLVVVAGIVMFFCMYFFGTTFFNYGWKKAPSESETFAITYPQHIEITTNAVKIEIMSAAESKVVYTDKFTGIVKGTKLDDGSLEISRSYATILDDNNTTSITTVEPNKGIFAVSESVLQVYLSEETLEQNVVPNIKINTEKSNVFVNLDKYKCNIEFNGKGKSSLTISNFVSKLTGDFGIGKVVCEGDVGSVNVTTKTGTVQIKGNVIGDTLGSENIKPDVNVYADNANLKFNAVNGTLTYLGKSSGEASGGKITADSIGNGLTIESRSFDANIGTLVGGCNIIASSSGNITINKYDDITSSNKSITTGKGDVKISHLNVNNITIETTTGSVDIVATSSENNTNNNTIDVKTTNGSVNITACEINNEKPYKFIGKISVNTTKGDIVVKEIYCLVNLVSSDNGKVVGYFKDIVTDSSVESNHGDCIANIEAGTTALLNVIANDKSIKLPNTTSFREGTKLTPIYNANVNDISNTPVLTLISLNGHVEVKQVI